MKSRAVAAAVLGMLGCGGAVDVGEPAYFASGFETGDFAEWMTGGDRAFGRPGRYRFPGGSQAITTSPVRRGRYAAHFELALDDGEQQHAGLLLGGLPDEVVLSAWYLLPRAHDARYWVVFQLREPKPDGTAPDVPVSALSLSGRGGVMRLGLVYGDQLLAPVAQAPMPFPVGRWVRLEMRYQRRTPAAGRVTLWQDGVLAFEREDVPPAGAAVYWNLGSIAEEVTPAPAVVFIDDVSMSPARLP